MPVSVAVFVFDDFLLLDIAGPLAVFESANYIAPGFYDIRLVAIEAGAVRSASGVSVLAEAADKVSAPDILLVAGGQGAQAASQCPVTLNCVRSIASEARMVASVCNGAFIVAATGLMDGRRVTTHWAEAADLARLFPAVIVDAEAIYIDDGHVWSSAGVSAGIDLALALVERNFGVDVARQIAGALVVYHRRPGTQSQFSRLLDIAGAAPRFARLMSWARQNLDQRLSVEQLAAEAGLSPRQFSRAFKAATGISPAKAVAQLRVEAARAQIDAGAQSLESVARANGFGGSQRMRRAVRRVTGLSPSASKRAK